MDDKADTGGRADEDIPGRLNMKVAGPAMAAGAVSLGLVLIGACGIGHKDVYVAPPPLAADLQVATSPLTRSATTTTPAVLIPPSPTWRVAANTPARRTTSTTASTTAATEPYPAEATSTMPRIPAPTVDPYPASSPGDETTTTTRPHHPSHTVDSEPSTEPYPAPTVDADDNDR